MVRRLLATALGAAALLPVADAAAGTYKVEMCRLSDGTPAPVDGWTGLHQNTCGGAGSFGLRWDASAQVGETATATLSPPPNVAIARADVWRTFDAPVSFSTAQPRVSSTWETRGWSGSGGYGGDSASNAYNPAAPDNALTVTSPSSLRLRLECLFNGPATPNLCTWVPYYLIRKLDLTMSDAVPPQVTQSPTGALLSGDWLTGETAALTIGASDVGAGAYRAFIRTGSATTYAPLSAGHARCADAEPEVGTAYEFTHLVPCPTASGTYVPIFDLGALGDGEHTNVTIGVEDAAGNERVALTSQTLRINAPEGALPDPGSPCTNGTTGLDGSCDLLPPLETSAPLLTGAAVEGSTLATDDGTWDRISGATWSFGWQRCDAFGGACVDIATAIGRSYATTAEDVGKRVRSKVTVTTAGGSATAFSTPSPLVVASGTDGGGGGGGGGGTGGGGTVTPVPPAGGGGGGGSTTTGDKPKGPSAQPTGEGGDAPQGATRPVNGTGGSGAATMAVRANGDTRRQVTVRYGRKVVIDGRLATPGGRPIAGATIDVLTTPKTGATTARREAPVVSDDDGSFRIVLPTGPSRTVRFAYRAHLDDAEYAETTEVDVRVRTAARLKARPRALRNGAAVKFRGTVRGAPRGSRKVVEMQVQQEGRWLTFATTRVRGGRFAHRYRFTRTRTRTTYVFRAIVRSDAGWPYETGASNKTRVVVRP